MEPRQVEELLYHPMDDAPFHKICYSSSVTTKEIIDYLDENGKDSAIQIDFTYGMTHDESPRSAPVDSIAALLSSYMEAAAFCFDDQ